MSFLHRFSKILFIHHHPGRHATLETHFHGGQRHATNFKARCRASFNLSHACRHLFPVTAVTAKATTVKDTQGQRHV